MSKDLLKACEKGDFKSVKSLLKLSKLKIEPGVKHQIKGIDINFKDKNGRTPLMLSCLSNSFLCVEALLLCSATVDMRDEKGNTALHYAASSNSSESIINALLIEKCSINARNEYQDTPLHVASENNHPDVVVILLKNAANCKILNSKKKSCIDIAAEKEHLKICSLLISEPGMNKSYKALFSAITPTGYQIVKTLLEGGMSPICRDDDNNTPLHIAASLEYYEISELLLQYGASIVTKNDGSINPVDILKKSKSETSKKILNLMENLDQIEKKKPTVIESFSLKNVQDYSLMKSKIDWIGENRDVCSSPTGTNWALCDGNKNTHCQMPFKRNSDNFWIFNLRREYNISGIRIMGNASNCMINEARIEISSSLDGPWKIVQQINCEKIGSVDYQSHAGVAQDFMDFNFTSQFIKLLVLSNHGGFSIAISQVSFYGFDKKIIELLDSFECHHLIENLSKNSFNHIDDLWILQNKNSILNEICNNNSRDISKLKLLIQKAHSENNKLTYLKLSGTSNWPLKHIQTNRLPELVIEGDPGTDDKIELYFENCLNVEGELVNKLMPDVATGGPSLVKFKNIRIKDEGVFYYGIRSIENPAILCDETLFQIQIETKRLEKDEIMNSITESLALFDI